MTSTLALTSMATAATAASVWSAAQCWSETLLRATTKAVMLLITLRYTVAVAVAVDDVAAAAPLHNHSCCVLLFSAC